MDRLKIGIVGCDTSHCSRFAEILNAGGAANAEIVAAWPGGSESVDPGFARREKFTAELRGFGVPLLESPEAVAESADALMILSADGRRHLEEFLRCARPGKPVFIDKPLALSSRDAEAIFEHGEKIGAPVFSASALRYSRPLASCLAGIAGKERIGADIGAPATWLTREQGFFFYGIHAVEMLFAVMGPGCVEVVSVSNDFHDVCVGHWADGRIGTVRGNRVGNKTFSATLHATDGTRFLENAIPVAEPIYLPLLETVIGFFRSGTPPVSRREMLEVIRFIEAAAESAASGRRVAMEPARAAGMEN